MDSREVETLARTSSALPIERADGRSSERPAESVFDWADKLLARFPAEGYDRTAIASHSSLFNSDSSIAPLGSPGNPESTGGEATIRPPGDQGGFHGFCVPPNLVATESSSPLFRSAASYPSSPSFPKSYDWSTSTPPPSTHGLSVPNFCAAAFVTLPPPPPPLNTFTAPSTSPTKRTKVYVTPTSLAGDRSSSSALFPPLHAMETSSVDPAPHAGGSISVEEAPWEEELEKAQQQQQRSTDVRTWFPSFPGIATADVRDYSLGGESQRGVGSTSVRSDKAAGAVPAHRNATTTTSEATALAQFKLDSTDHCPVPIQDDTIFSPWTRTEADSLTLDGRQSEPPNFDYDQNVGSWVTYRRSQISFDVSFSLPPGLDLTRLCTTTNAVPIERFEVEVTSWSNAGGNRKVDLHQLDKSRTISQAVPLGRQVLRPCQTSEGSELDSSPVHTTNDSNDEVLLPLFLTTHFRRVHYARSTPNDLRHHSVCDSAVVMHVSVVALHTDASESVLGGWTSAPHVVRGRSRVQFGSGDGAAFSTAAASSSKSLAAGPVRERRRNVKAKKKRYQSAEFIEDSDAEAGT